MRDKAYAKINLSLDVICRRDDGYHELSMVMTPINFYDIVEIEISDTMSITQSVGFIPLDESNTALKAIKIMREEFGFKENFKINIIKHIPTQAGLAGGSADAAATIRIVKKLLNIQASEEKMIEIAKKVGADVPFCYKNVSAIVEGIGEKIKPFKVKEKYKILLVKPKKGVSTKLAFSNLDFNSIVHPNTELMKIALENADYKSVIQNLGNSLEQPSFKLVPSIKLIKEKLLEFGFDGALMSGSGSTVFGISKDDEIISLANNHFRKLGYFVRITTIL